MTAIEEFAATAPKGVVVVEATDLVKNFPIRAGFFKRTRRGVDGPSCAAAWHRRSSLPS